MGFPRFRVDTKQSRSVLRSYSKIELDRRGYEQLEQVGPFWRYTKEVYRHTQPVEHTLRVE
jgi:hypothetical protein